MPWNAKMRLGLWTAVSPFLGCCGEADSPMSPWDSDGTDCAVGEQKRRRVSGAEPRHPPAAAWAGRRPQGPAEDEGKGGREARMRSFGAGNPGAGSPLAPPGPQPGSRCEPRCVAGLRFRVGPRCGQRCWPRSVHSRSGPPPFSGPRQAVAARPLPGPHGWGGRRERPEAGEAPAGSRPLGSARPRLTVPGLLGRGASVRGRPRSRPHRPRRRPRRSLRRVPLPRRLISADRSRAGRLRSSGPWACLGRCHRQPLARDWAAPGRRQKPGFCSPPCPRRVTLDRSLKIRFCFRKTGNNNTDPGVTEPSSSWRWAFPGAWLTWALLKLFRMRY